MALSSDGKRIFASIDEEGIRTGTDFGFSKTKLRGYDWYQTNARYRIKCQALSVSDNVKLVW